MGFKSTKSTLIYKMVKILDGIIQGWVTFSKTSSYNGLTRNDKVFKNRQPDSYEIIQAIVRSNKEYYKLLEENYDEPNHGNE